LLFPPRRTEALVEATSQSHYEALVRPRSISIYSIEALLPYGDIRVQALIWELKYKDSGRASAIGGALLASFLLEVLADEMTESALLIPIPLFTDRLRERGYNQSERLAGEIARALPLLTLTPSALTRTRNTPRQTELKRKERLANMEGAFEANAPIIEGRTCVLIDDVVTTGSTLEEARKTLMSAGAHKVIAIALAYA